MPVADDVVRQARRDLAEAHDVDTTHLAELRSLAELIGFMVAASRAEGRGDGIEDVELLVRALGLDKETIAEAELVLRALGYTEISALLRWLAGRARRKPAWLQRIEARRRGRNRPLI